LSSTTNRRAKTAVTSPEIDVLLCSCFMSPVLRSRRKNTDGFAWRSRRGHRS
jgi:hypothetical protein